MVVQTERGTHLSRLAPDRYCSGRRGIQRTWCVHSWRRRREVWRHSSERSPEGPPRCGFVGLRTPGRERPSLQKEKLNPHKTPKKSPAQEVPGKWTIILPILGHEGTHNFTWNPNHDQCLDSGYHWARASTTPGFEPWPLPLSPSHLGGPRKGEWTKCGQNSMKSSKTGFPQSFPSRFPVESRWEQEERKLRVEKNDHKWESECPLHPWSSGWVGGHESFINEPLYQRSPQWHESLQQRGKKYQQNFAKRQYLRRNL